MDASHLLYDPIVLNAVAKEPMHLYAVMLRLSRETGVGFSVGCVQKTLKRLWLEGAFYCTWDSRHRKLYSLTASGRAMLREKTGRLLRLVGSVQKEA